MITTQEQQIAPTAKGNLKLIKGEFTPQEALEIVDHLFSEKINFHEKNNFSKFIRTGERDEATTQRIDELKDAFKQAKTVIEEAERSGKKVRMNSTISFELI